MMKTPHHHIYVVELDQIVLEDKRFKAANPNLHEEMPLYVGMTGVSPEQRYENHKRGYKASRYVRKFGLKLLPDLYEHLNPMSYEQAAIMEKALAVELRGKGHPVWQR